MKKLKILLISLSLLVLTSEGFGQTFDYTNPSLNIATSDGATSTYPYKLKVTNGTLTDNGDGTATLTTGGGGGGGGSTNAAGSDTQIQYNNSDSFGASSKLTFNATNSVLTVDGDISFQAATGQSLQVSSANVLSLSVPQINNLNKAGLVKTDISGNLSVDASVYFTSFVELDPQYTADKYSFVPYNGATGSVVLGVFDLQAKTLGASDSVISAGEVHSTSDTTASGSIISANSATASILDILSDARINGYYLPRTTGASGEVLTTQTGNLAIWTPTLTTQAYNTVQDEGSGLTQRTTMNFTGAGVTASDSGGVTTVNIPAASNAAASGAVNFIFDGGGSAIATDAIIWVRIPYSCTLTEWDITAYSTAPTLIVDFRKSTYSDFYPESVQGSIAGSAIPTLTNQQKNTNQTLSGWTTAVNQGDYIYARVTNIDTATYAVVTLSYTK